MKTLKITLICLVLFLAMAVGNVWAEIGLPTTNFTGSAITVATVGAEAGYLELVDVEISQANYLDGSVTTTNGVDESIIGMTVTIAGATRTGDYTFTDAVITVSDGSFNYLSATLSNIVFVTDGIRWYLNPGLDINNPSTLNLSNIVLNTDAPHPSRYIDELNVVKGAGDSLGMKIIVQILTGSMEGDSYSNISTGLIDGSPPSVDPPSGARTIGYWKNHDEEREFFIYSATYLSSVFTYIDDLNYSLSKKGKKSMLEKAKQQVSALLLNMASSLDPSTLLNDGELEILQLIDPTADATATVQDAVSMIESVINNGPDSSMEDAKDLADEINNRDHRG